MNGNGPPYHGRSEGPDAKLDDAIANAWDNAKGKHAEAGWYAVHDIKVQTSNPIHAYSVLISPTDPPGDH